METHVCDIDVMNTLLQLGMRQAGPQHEALLYAMQSDVAATGTGLISCETLSKLVETDIVAEVTRTLPTSKLLELANCVDQIKLVYPERTDLDDLSLAVRAAYHSMYHVGDGGGGDAASVEARQLAVNEGGGEDCSDEIGGDRQVEYAHFKKATDLSNDLSGGVFEDIIAADASRPCEMVVRPDNQDDGELIELVDASASHEANESALALDTLLQETDDAAPNDTTVKFSDVEAIECEATKHTKASARVSDPSPPTSSEFVESVTSGTLLAPDQLLLLLVEDTMDEIVFSLSVDEVAGVTERLLMIAQAEKAAQEIDKALEKSDWSDVLISLRLSIEDAVVNGREELTCCLSLANCDDDAKPEDDILLSLALTPNGIRGKSAKPDVQVAGKILSNALSTCELDPALRLHVDRMASQGLVLSTTMVKSLDECGAFKTALTQTSRGQICELETALGQAMLSSPDENMVRLWLLFNRELAVAKPPAEPVEVEEIDLSDIHEKANDARDTLQQIASWLLTAVDSSKELVVIVSKGLYEELSTMRELGKATSEHINTELNQILPSVVEVLSNTELRQLQDAVRQAADAGVIGSQALNATLQICINDAVVNGRDFLQVAEASTIVQGGMKAGEVAVTSVFKLENTLKMDQTWQELCKTVENAETWSKSSRQKVDQAIQLTRSKSQFGRWSSQLSQIPMMRVDLLRNYIQSSALLFSGLFDFDKLQEPIMRLIKYLGGYLLGVVSLSFHIFRLQDPAMVVFGMVVALCFMLAYERLVKFDQGFGITKPEDMHREGQVAVTWSSIAAADLGEKRLRHFGYALVFFLTFYFPITQFTLETAVSRDSLINRAFIELDSVEVMLLRVFCGIFFLGFGLVFPVFLYSKIRANAPAAKNGRTFDIDGRQVVLQGHVFTRLVTRHPNHVHCPYRTFYSGFEQEYCFYKLAQLVARVALLLPIVASSKPETRAPWSFAISTLSLGLFASVYIRKSRIFVDPLDNFIESASQLSTWFTSVSALIVRGSHPNAALQRGVGMALTVVTTATFALQIFGLFVGTPFILLELKNCFGVFTFSNTDRDIEDGLLTSVVPKWDLDKECLYRIWQPFWRSLLQEKCGIPAIRRLTELEVVAMEFGRERIEKHWDVEKTKTAFTCQTLQALLEGVDVFVDLKTIGLDTEHEKITCGFGKLVIQPYPFECKVSWDANKDEYFQFADTRAVEPLLQLNLSPDIAQRRVRRMQLRGLSANEALIEFPFERTETETIEDGSVETVDELGFKATKKRMSQVSFTCRYTMAKIVVTGESEKPMVPGFKVKVMYADGCGEYVAPTTKQVTQVHNRSLELGIDHLGLTNDMELVGTQWKDISKKHATLFRRRGREVRQSHHKYRLDLAASQKKANTILSDAFWYKVYTNPTITRPDLEKYLSEHESNTELRDLPVGHGPELILLFWRMHFVQSHPGYRAWYVFWDDFYARNGTMNVVAKHAADFDPMQLSSICYRLMPREALRAWLSEKQLMGSPFLVFFGRPLFSGDSLDCLYNTVEAHSKAMTANPDAGMQIGKTTVKQIEDPVSTKISMAAYSR